MKARRTIEDFQRDIAERRSTPGDEERKQRIKANGLECLRRLHGDQTWEDWEGVAAAMEVITEEAQDAVGTSEWDKDNKRLVREFNSRWDDYEATLGSNHKPLSKQERWAVRTIMITPEIRTWRGLLDGPQKRKLNHPNAVINKWKATTQTREARAPRQPSPALSPALAARDKKIAELEARNTELGEELTAVRESAPSASRDEMRQCYVAFLQTLPKEEQVEEIRKMIRLELGWTTKEISLVYPAISMEIGAPKRVRQGQKETPPVEKPVKTKRERGIKTIERDVGLGIKVRMPVETEE